MKQAVLLFCFVCAGLSNNVHGQAEEIRPLRIGVVNVAAIFERYEKSINSQKRIDRLTEQMKADARKIQMEMKALKKELDFLKPGQEAYMKKRGDLREKEIEFEVSFKVKRKELADLNTMLTAEIYRNLRTAIAEYGKMKKYDLILKDDDVDAQNQTREKVLTEINVRSVLYYSASMDVTADILNMLNEQYRKGEDGMSGGSALDPEE